MRALACSTLFVLAACGGTSIDRSSPSPLRTDCDGPHPRIGQRAVLTERSHGTRGVATVADACTIEVTELDYDGKGRQVHFLGGTAGVYDDGVVLSGDLLRDQPYEAERLSLRLAVGASLDQLDGISLWCVSAGTSFGDGLFEAPGSP